MVSARTNVKVLFRHCVSHGVIGFHILGLHTISCALRIWKAYYSFTYCTVTLEIFINVILRFSRNNGKLHLQLLPAHRYMRSTLPETAGIPKIPSYSFTPIAYFHCNSIMPKLYSNCNSYSQITLHTQSYLRLQSVIATLITTFFQVQIHPA